MSDRAFYRRQFLNNEEQGGTAFVEGSVDFVRGKPEHKSLDAGLKIADCDRVVTLQFGIWSEEDATNIRQKINKFRRTVDAFATALIAQIDEYDK